MTSCLGLSSSANACWEPGIRSSLICVQPTPHQSRLEYGIFCQTDDQVVVL